MINAPVGSDVTLFDIISFDLAAAVAAWAFPGQTDKVSAHFFYVGLARAGRRVCWLDSKIISFRLEM